MFARLPVLCLGNGMEKHNTGQKSCILQQTTNIFILCSSRKKIKFVKFEKSDRNIEILQTRTHQHISIIEWMTFIYNPRRTLILVDSQSTTDPLLAVSISINSICLRVGPLRPPTCPHVVHRVEVLKENGVLAPVREFHQNTPPQEFLRV
jgi:hypothetical protein